MTIEGAFQKIALSRHRLLVLIHGDWQAGVETARHMCEGLNNVYGHKIDESGQASLPIKDILGAEFDAAIVNLWQGFDLNLVAAVSGSIKAGGALFLICPTLYDWPDFTDPEVARWTPFGCNSVAIENRFIRRFIRIANADPDIITLRAENPEQSRVAATLQPNAASRVELNPEQREAIDAVKHVITGQRRRPVVITADRGRGKSTVFGVAARELLQKHCHIVVLSMSRQAVVLVYRHLTDCFAASADDIQSIERSSSKVEFLNYEQLLRLEQKPDLVLVDEAATFPLGLLQHILKNFSRLAFASTVHGYEGSGRGFVVKFQDLVNQHSRGVVNLTLTDPVRFGSSDPLERFIYESLLLDAEPASLTTGSEAAAVAVRKVDKSELLDNENLLRQIIGLLVQAHYRTSPNDLRQCLDSAQLSLYLAQQDGDVVGVVLLATEGQLSEEVSKQVWSGATRPRGHLMAESLCVQLGEEQGCVWKGGRIVRIVVHPDRRRRGIGRKLLQKMERLLSDEKFDYLGSSFSLGPTIIPFWRSVNMQVVRLGYRSQTASAAPSLLVVKALNEDLRDTFARLESRFRQLLLLELPGRQCDLQANYVAELLQVRNLSRAVSWEVGLRRFINGGCSIESVWLNLNEASVDIVSDPEADRSLQELLVECVLKQRMQSQGSSGRAQLMERIRSGLKDYLANQ